MRRIAAPSRARRRTRADGCRGAWRLRRRRTAVGAELTSGTRRADQLLARARQAAARQTPHSSRPAPRRAPAARFARAYCSLKRQKKAATTSVALLHTPGETFRIRRPEGSGTAPCLRLTRPRPPAISAPMSAVSRGPGVTLQRAPGTGFPNSSASPPSRSSPPAISRPVSPESHLLDLEGIPMIARVVRPRLRRRRA